MVDELELARARARAMAKAKEGGGKSYKGTVLPFSTDEEGKAHFDITAGIPGMAIEGVKALGRAVTLPREVYDGKVDLNTDEGTGRVLEAATIISPMSPASRVAVRPGRVAPPSADDLFDTAGRQYDAVRSSGVDYNSGAVGRMATGLRDQLNMDGILDVNAPQTHAIIGRLANPPGNSVAPIQNLEAARRAFSKIAQQSADATERGAASRAVETITGFIEAADPATVVAGPAAEAGRTIASARGNYSAGMRSDLLTGTERNADLRAAAANSGQNIGNSIRSRLASLLINKDGRGLRAFSPEEVAQIEGVVEGSRTANALRKGGNILGGGGGLGAAVVGGLGATAGAAAGGLPGAAVGGALAPIAGAAMKSGSNALTRRALRAVEQGTRGRSPLMAERMANAPMTPVHSGRAAALSRALLLLEAEKQAGYEP